MTAGQTFTVAGTIGLNASDPVATHVSGLTSLPDIAIPSGASRYNESGGYDTLTSPTLTFPSSNPYNIYLGPNFKKSQVPAPSALVVLLIGAGPGAAVLLRRRRKA